MKVERSQVPYQCGSHTGDWKETKQMLVSKSLVCTILVECNLYLCLVSFSMPAYCHLSLLSKHISILASPIWWDTKIKLFACPSGRRHFILMHSMSLCFNLCACLRLPPLFPSLSLCPSLCMSLSLSACLYPFQYVCLSVYHICVSVH